jgi:hypothetical protein
MNTDNIVVYKTFVDPTNANIIKGLLESYEIECFLSDENMTGMYSPFTPAIGGVKLNVFEKDISRINSILNAENSYPENLSTENEEVIINCPKCQSTNVSPGNLSKKKFRFWIMFILSAISFNPLFSQPINKQKAYHCFDCDNDFEKV